MRLKCWSDSKFAKWLRGDINDGVKIMSMHGYRQYRGHMKDSRPIRFWIAEHLDAVQDMVWMIPNGLRSIKNYLLNRFYTRTHLLTSSQADLKKGEWHELDDRMLFCNFNELKNFVEIDCMLANYGWKENKTAWPFFRRSSAAGVDLLQKRITDSDSENLESNDTAAEEILELYTWWTEIRPARPEYQDSYFDETADNYFQNSSYCDNSERMERYDVEDDEMLVRLMKIRRNLWT